jgi:hypothetical protein
MFIHTKDFEPLKRSINVDFYGLLCVRGWREGGGGVEGQMVRPGGGGVPGGGFVGSGEGEGEWFVGRDEGKWGCEM